MGVFTELGVAGPVPFVLHAPALSDQSQQGIWAGPQAGVAPRGALVQPHRGVRLFNPPRGALVQPTKMAPDAALTAAPRHGVADHLHDPGTAGLVRLDVLGRLFGMQFPDSVSPVLLLMIRCRERAPAFSLELATDLAVEGSAGWLSQSGGRRTPAPGTGFVGVEGLLSQGDAKGAGVERDLGCIDAVCRMR